LRFISIRKVCDHILGMEGIVRLSSFINRVIAYAKKLGSMSKEAKIPLTSWSVNLEGGHWWYTHVVELPGCFSRIASKEEEMLQLLLVAERRISWLRTRELSWPILSSLGVEEQHDIPELSESGGAVALFSSDLMTVDDRALKDAITLMSLSRVELLDVVNRLTETEFNAEPILGKRNVRKDINHIVNAEEWYISRLGPRYQHIYEDNIRPFQPSCHPLKG